MNSHRVKLAKLIMAFAQQDPDVSDDDALSFVKFNKFPVTVNGKEIVTYDDMVDIMKALEGKPDAPETIAPTRPCGLFVGDKVKVTTDDGEVEGEIKDVRYQVLGLGNKYYKADDVEKL